MYLNQYRLINSSSFILSFQLFDAFLYDGCMHSFKNLQQLICYGGEVLLESWKIKGTSERERTGYTQELIFHFRWWGIFMWIIFRWFPYHILTALSCVDPCPDKISKANKTGTGVLAIHNRANIRCLSPSRYAALNEKPQILFHFLRMGKRLGWSWDSSPALRKEAIPKKA